jgi:hypothetical protein
VQGFRVEIPLGDFKLAGLPIPGEQLNRSIIMQNAKIVSIVSVQKRTSIINRYADLASQMSTLKKALDAAKDEAIETLGVGEFATSDAELVINWVSRPYFDQAKAKGFLTPAQIAECSKTSSFYDVRAKKV